VHRGHDADLGRIPRHATPPADGAAGETELELLDQLDSETEFDRAGRGQATTGLRSSDRSASATPSRERRIPVTNGRSSRRGFCLIQARLRPPGRYGERRALLEELVLDAPAWRTPRSLVLEDPAEFLSGVESLGLEGAVAKRLDRRL
jgi:hypothetical protein